MHLYVRLEYANTVADNDGRSIFGALYIVIALVSIFELGDTQDANKKSKIINFFTVNLSFQEN